MCFYVTYLLNVGDIEMEWASSMNHCLEGRIGNNGLIEGIGNSDIGHNRKTELITRIWVGLLDFVRLFLAADCRHD